MNISKTDIGIGDIIFVEDAIVGGIHIGGRPFVVNFVGGAGSSQIMMYEISSQDKVGDDYPYNQPITMSATNGLNRDSHVKCDLMFINSDVVISERVWKFGTLEPGLYAKGIEDKTREAETNKEFFFIDQLNNGMPLEGWSDEERDEERKEKAE